MGPRSALTFHIRHQLNSSPLISWRIARISPTPQAWQRRISECVGLRRSTISWLENKIYIWQRKAVSDYLDEGKKADVRTIQDTLRHENPDVTLARHTESGLESRLAAQDVMADAILSDLKRVQ